MRLRHLGGVCVVLTPLAAWAQQPLIVSIPATPPKPVIAEPPAPVPPIAPLPGGAPAAPQASAPPAPAPPRPTALQLLFPPTSPPAPPRPAPQVDANGFTQPLYGCVTPFRDGTNNEHVSVANHCGEAVNALVGLVKGECCTEVTIPDRRYARTNLLQEDQGKRYGVDVAACPFGSEPVGVTGPEWTPRQPYRCHVK